MNAEDTAARLDAVEALLVHALAEGVRGRGDAALLLDRVAKAAWRGGEGGGAGGGDAAANGHVLRIVERAKEMAAPGAAQGERPSPEARGLWGVWEGRR